MKGTNFLMTVLALPFFIACNKSHLTTIRGETIAPILLNISMPSESNSIPGEDVYIGGVGFSIEDSISCKSLEDELDFIASIVSVDDFGVTIAVPENAGGEYEVSVTRAGLTTILEARLFVAYMFKIEDLSVPETALPGETLLITGENFEDGDQLRFEADHYPDGIPLQINTVLTTEGVSVTIPEECYGINSLIFIRGKRISAAGEITIPVQVGDQIGGGTVFYVSEGGGHGLIAAPTNVVDKQAFGPSVRIDPYASGTTGEIYAGKSNTAILVDGIISYRDNGFLAETTVAEMCNNYFLEKDGNIYDDWFLGSLDEMVALFNYRATLEDPRGLIPNNNYWTSTVASTTVWAAQYNYVNFYETIKLVTGSANAVNWTIAARPIRQF